MGAKDSKRTCLSYDDAVKRMSDVELKRVCETFKRLTGGKQLLSQTAFVGAVLGDGVPPPIADAIFSACGGGARGIQLRDLICGLVLLTKGTRDERVRFLWHLYAANNDACTHIARAGHQEALLAALFAGERVTYEQFREWIACHEHATVLSTWLLTSNCVSLSSDVETPTFYQSLAGVTHLEERDICELEKCFWSLQAASPSGQLDASAFATLVSPPLPASACAGLFLALDANRDAHVDFKELCCGISAACRGPIAERTKFCFKIFDIDGDGALDAHEFQHMVDVLQLLATTPTAGDTLATLRVHVQTRGALAQEDFLVWCVEQSAMVAPLLELLFQVCHVALGLRPRCRHHEHEIVNGWLTREQHRGYRVGQFWYLVANEWWQTWCAHTTTARCACDGCDDESAASSSTTSSDSMGDLLLSRDTCSIASSSGVSSGSGGGGGVKRTTSSLPGPIDNASLVCDAFDVPKVVTLTGEGCRLRRDTPLVQGRDFQLLPDSLWKALALWYGSPLPLPRQVIKPPGAADIELELYPLNLRVFRHQGQTATARVLAHTAAFSRLANVRQVLDYLAGRLALRVEDARLWLMNDDAAILLEEDGVTLQELGVADDDGVLLEVRNKDLTWPEEMGALATGGALRDRRPTICLPPGATGLHNLGNTCFMNAALQAVSNTRPLTQYFQRDAQLTELNVGNPLGTKGQLARRYAELCRELWAGSTRSVAPLRLRWCVSRHAPTFGGGGQHDAQELLAWLLDALHEDLNRVQRKRYTPLEESGGRADAVVAAEAWSHHLARDHSIITDLFYGQLKSKVTCETCGGASVRFDAFNALSLPLPMDSCILCEVLLLRLDGDVPIKYGMRLAADARYADIKRTLAAITDEPLLGVVVVVEVACARIRHVLADTARINPITATELYAYELDADIGSQMAPPDNDDDDEDTASNAICRPTPEVSSASALCMPNILCFKSLRSHAEMTSAARRVSNAIHSRSPPIFTDVAPIRRAYVIAMHRKCVRQETYFLSQHKSKASLFGVPLLLACTASTSCQSVYEAVWRQVTRLLSPSPQADQTNHATDCDDSLGYEFPFALKAVGESGHACAVCHWTQFCRGCQLPCSETLLFDVYGQQAGALCVAIDWDPTALHLRYQCSREKMWREHESVAVCRRLHTEPIDLDDCLQAFTSEERLEARYHCSTCKAAQPATKKLQVWRLPPILIVHLKRFDYRHSKWVKTQKAVNFPYRDFDPTAYLASVPQETIRRHRQQVEDGGGSGGGESPTRRQRLESTSLQQTPVVDGEWCDFHEHRLQQGADAFDLNYHLYAVVCHSGMLNGGHYVSYARNPNGNWYCYNDSSCREVANAEKLPQVGDDGGGGGMTPKIDTSAAYILFYERAGLDYAPYLPDVRCNGDAAAISADEEMDDGESELQKQCVLQ